MAGPFNNKQAVLSLHFTGAALPYGAVTTFGFRDQNDAAIDGAAIIDDIATAAEALHQLISAGDVWLDHVELKVGPVDSGPTHSAAVNVEGEQGDHPDSPNVAYLFRKRVSGMSGKYGGRSYYPGVSEGNTTAGGSVAPAAVTSYQSAMDNFLLALETVDLIPVVFSTDPDPSGVARDVVAVTLQPKVATQRRRLRR